MADRVMENAEGIKLRLTIKDSDGVAVDISTATTKEIYFRKPDGTTVSKTGTFNTDGTDGKLYYSTESGFLTPNGKWHLQAYVVIGTVLARSTLVTQLVEANVEG
jgi:hypothetical protein